MLQFENRTDFAGTVFASPDPDGIDTLYTVVKGTFDLGAGLARAEDQVDIVMADEHYGDPATSSVRVPSDLCLVKPATDVMLLGHAWAPGGKPAHYVDVTLQAGPLVRQVRVFGDRVWGGLTGHSASAPEPFAQMPLVWERAFGGMDEGRDGPTGDARNPVGSGFRAPHSRTPTERHRLPNLEDPADPISSPRQMPAPACFAPIAAHWYPRREFAGTYDQAWQESRAPYLPLDFDSRFFQCAAPGLTAAGFFTGGELIDIRGASPDGWLQFALPSVAVQVTYRLGGADQQRPANLDTVIIEPDANRVILVWRAALACDKSLLRVESITAAIDSGNVA